jgi:hypothetical protein
MRNDRIGNRRKCANVNCRATLPRPRRQRHAATLTDESYAVYMEAARDIHGVTDESCCVCGKPRSPGRKLDRDHGHRKGQADYGKPRGLVCGGNQGCNVLMLPWITAATARGIARAKALACEPDADRWALIAGYLMRVERFYAREAVPVG